MRGTRCKCAKDASHYLKNGTRVERFVGKPQCPVCRGRGSVIACQKCNGCGMVPGSQVCGDCIGCGKVPA